MSSSIFLFTLFFFFFNFSHNFGFANPYFGHYPVYHQYYPGWTPIHPVQIPYQQRSLSKSNRKVKRSKNSINTNYVKDDSGQVFKIKSVDIGPSSEKISIGDDDYDVTVEGGMREIKKINPKEEVQYVENYPSQRVQTSGAGIYLPYPLTVGGVPFSSLSYPFGVDVSSKNLKIPFPTYNGEPQVFDPEHKLHDIMIDSEDFDDYPYNSKYCDTLSDKEKKRCIAMLSCSKRKSCYDCTYDLKCFWCSSSNSCFPSKFFAKDSFTGMHCPASDMYYFQTCRIKSFIVMFFVITFLLVAFFGLIIFILALIWRRSRRTKIYNIIKNKDEVKDTYNDSLLE